jgi:hypothetical protein
MSGTPQEVLKATTPSVPSVSCKLMGATDWFVIRHSRCGMQSNTVEWKAPAPPKAPNRQTIVTWLARRRLWFAAIPDAAWHSAGTG